MANDDHFFTPESVDEQVERLSRQHDGSFSAEDEAASYLVKDLHRGYQAQSQERQQTLERAWQRIQQRNRLAQSPTQDLPVLQQEQQRRGRKNRWTLYSQRLNMIAAVLIAGLLVGSMLIVLNIARQGQRNSTATSTATSVTSTPVLPSQMGATVYTYADSSAIYAVDWSPDSARVASASATVHIWDATTGGHVVTITPAQVHGPFAAHWSADGKYIATAASGLQIWNADSGNLVTSCPDPGNQTAAAPTKDSSTFFSYASGSSTFQRASALDTSLTNKEMVPVNLAWSPDGRSVAIIATQTATPEVIVVNVPSCKVIDTHPYKNDIPYDVKWSPNGKYLAVSTSDRIVQVWEIGKAQPRYTYHDPYDTDIFTLAWSPDSQWIASTSYGSHKVEVWDALTGASRQEYSGHQDAVTSLAWSPDGKKIASGSASVDDNGNVVGGEVQIWDVKTTQTLYTYKGNPYPVLAVAWSPNGKLIASADSDSNATSDAKGNGEVKVWVAG